MDRRIFDYLERKMRWSEDERDSRRGVKGTGRGRSRGGRGRGRDYEDGDYRDSRRRRDYRDYEDEDERDYDYEYDYEDGHDKPLRLTKSDMRRWKAKMKNYDGTKGEKYDAEQIDQVARKMGIRFDEFSEKEFCLAVNMIYSDYGHVLKKFVSPDKELHLCAELAQAFLDDPDGPEPSEKLALYFHCIADADV